MMPFLRSWFTPPTYTNEKDNFRASILHVTASSLVVFTLLVVLANLLDSQTPIRNYVIDANALCTRL
jgi:hypothetical protein